MRTSKIRKFITFIIMLTWVTHAYSQDLSNLDEKYGINKFRLESTLDSYKNELLYKGAIDGLELYSYKNLKEIKIFGKNVNELSFTFYKNKLHSISVVLNTASKSEELEVLHKLENLFGRASEGENTSSYFKYEWAYFWETSKVYLGYNKMSLASEFKPGICNIYMISLKLQHQIDNDSF